VLSIFGGKITTYRKLAEHALDKLGPFFPSMGPAWTAKAALPGGDMPESDFDMFFADFAKRHPWLPRDLALHYARLYGTRAEQLLGQAKQLSNLGRHFGGLLHAREIDYLRETEWARTAEDVLDRRTKHGLHIGADAREAVRAYLDR
jgi:glycerol-3-phosphate dehydrogenase